MEVVDDADKGKVYFTAAGATDIGGSRENQDDMFIWERREEGILVVGILDGHGREVGRVAAQAARKAFLEYFDENYSGLNSDPVTCFQNGFQYVHAAIKVAFRVFYESNGSQVSEAETGYLMKKKNPAQNWSCVHGGTSCSIVALVGNYLYCANVGDSSVTLCTGTPISTTDLVEDVIDLGITSLPGGISSDPPVPPADPTPEKANTILFSAEHSPESVEEFYRMRCFRSRDTDSSQTALYVVYDSPSVEKILCPPVFFVDSDGTATVTNRGRYYKNVRNEWASLVATPPTAQFQDALAFTRSLGDFHLQTYGVSHLPMIRRMDVSKFFDKLRVESSLRYPVMSSVAPMTCSHVASLVVATDGIWDNWSYEDVTKFVMDDSCTKAVLQCQPKMWGEAVLESPQSEATGSPNKDSGKPLSGVQRVANSLIKRNAVFAKRNFGGDADNATGVVIYLAYEASASGTA